MTLKPDIYFVISSCGLSCGLLSKEPFPERYCFVFQVFNTRIIIITALSHIVVGSKLKNIRVPTVEDQEWNVFFSLTKFQ